MYFQIVYAFKYMYIWLCMAVYTANRHPRGVQDTFTVHLHLESWCVLHQADTDMIQHHPTSIQRAVTLAQLPCYVIVK